MSAPRWPRTAVLVEDRVGVVDVDQHLARGGRQLVQPLEHAASAGLRQVPHGARGLGRGAEADHLVVGPQRAIDQHAVGGLHRRPHMRLHLAQPGRVEQALAAGRIDERDADVVARLRAVAVRRVRWRIAGQRQGFEAEAGRAVDGKARLQREFAPVDSTVMAEHAEHRVAHRQVLAHAGGAPHRPRLAMLAQHVEAGGVVDLGIDQHDRRDAGVAQRARRLQRREAPDLLQHVGGGVEQHPVLVVATGGNRRLGTGLGADASLAQAVAVGAVAVPLRKATTGCGAEHADLHRFSCLVSRRDGGRSQAPPTASTTVPARLTGRRTLRIVKARNRAS